MKRIAEPELMLGDEQARAYAAADFAEPHDHFVDLLRGRLSVLPTRGRALDLGCGPGDITRRFARAFPDWTVDGLDGSPAMLKLGRRENVVAGLQTRIHFHQVTLPAAWTPHSDYELIFSNSLLHHLDDPQVLWNAVRRRAQPATRLFVMDLLRPDDEATARTLVEQHASGAPKILRRDFYNSLLAAYRPSEIMQQLRTAGLGHLQLDVVSDRHCIVWGRVGDAAEPDAAGPLPRFVDLPRLGRVSRIGLATRGNTSLDREAVLSAVDAGVNYLNWCGHDDGMRQAIRELGPRRADVNIAIQLTARTAEAARRELDGAMVGLATDVIDVVTYYYVEHQDEWDVIAGAQGAAEALEAARRQGRVKVIGLTSHQRALAARCASSERLDLMMVRYNAAHRGAEHDVFPVTQDLGIPVVAFTCLRWGRLLEATPDDPPDFQLPPAADWYRLSLMHPGVSVALMAPDGRQELNENLRLLRELQSLSLEEYGRLAAHGQRVRQHAADFP